MIYLRGELVRGIEKPHPISKRFVSLYGMRDTRCIRCRKYFRSSDVNKAGICAWCEYDREVDHA